MVAVNTRPEQDKDVAAWRAKGNYTFAVVLSPTEDFARDTYQVSGTPTNMLLNADGRMVFRHSGYGTGAEKILEAEIRELLGLEPFEGEPAHSRTKSADHRMPRVIVSPLLTTSSSRHGQVDGLSTVYCLLFAAQI